MQAELDKLRPLSAPAPVPAETLRKEREAVAARGGIVQKTAKKSSTDEHSWELYVVEQGLEIGDYPSVDQVVEFAICNYDAESVRWSDENIQVCRQAN